MEAFQVMQDENATYLLNKQLHDSGRSDFAYNIGISGHDFLRCAADLSNAINAFKPNKYIVIETGSVSFSATDVDDVLSGTYPVIPSHDQGIIGQLQRLPYLRLVYHQLQSFIGLNTGSNDAVSAPEDKDLAGALAPSYRNDFTRLIQKMSDTAKNASVKLIILYHPEISFKNDGSLQIMTNTDYLQLFSKACSENGVVFIDMSDKFLSEYQSQQLVPYGFSNTAVGVGHLNRDGHRMIADVLFQVIAKDEAGVT
ncbi:SGNH/GDSL hydrolase family protein [Oscillospiraceae bacterium WX1]